MALNERSKPINRRWWLESGDDLHGSVMDNYRLLKDQDTNKPDRYLAFMSLYMNRHITDDAPSRYMKELCQVGDEGYRRAKFNIVKLMVDTVHNRIAKMKPRARFLPTGGNASIHRRAKLLERYADSIADQTDLYKTAALSFLDACLFGTGVIKPYRCGSRMKIERVYPGEIYVDAVEAAYDNVRQLFHRKYVAREVVEYVYVDAPLQAGLIDRRKAGKLRKAVKEAQRSNAQDDFFGHELVTDPIEVVEAWHLPSGPGAKDGRHIISVDGASLLDETWERESFPLCFVRWSHEPRGFFGIGLAEELAPIHIDINKTLGRIEKSMDLNASPYVLTERGSKVKKSHITNIPGSIIDYSGTAPVIHTVNAVPPEFMTYLNNQVDRAFRIAKINNLGSGNKIPSGLETGAAVREWHDTDREDFAVVMNEFEKFYMDIIKEFVWLGKDAYKEDGSFTVVAQKDRNTVSRVKWSDVDMEEDSYVLRVHAASSLPASPSGRIDKVIEMMNAGLVDREQALRLMNIPDVDSAMDLATAASDNIQHMIERILDNGEPQVLEPFTDPQLALKMAQTAYDKAKVDGVPENRLTLLRMFMRQASEALQKQQQQALALQAGQVSPAAPPALDGSGQNPLAITGEE